MNAVAHPGSDRPHFQLFDDVQAFMAVRTGLPAETFALDNPETVRIADELGIAADVERFAKLRDELGPVIDASVKRAERASAEVLRFARNDGAAPAPRLAPLPRFWIDDANLAHRGAPYLIKGVLGARLLAMIYGPPGSGKTFFAGDIASHVAAGLTWRGRRTTPGLVVYIAAEAGSSIEPRFVAWRDRHIADAREERVPLVVITRGVNLLSHHEVLHLVNELRAIGAEAGMPPALIVVDTLSRSIPGGDENAASDVTRVIQAGDLIRDELGAGVLVVHHAGKTAERGARGHSSLTAACDTVIRVEDRVATIEKVRDGVAGETFPFELEVVSMGDDEDGDPRTTCVVVPAERAESAEAGRTGAVALGKNQQLALDVLRRALAGIRRALQERGDDPSKACVETAGWREATRKRMGLEDNAFRARWREVVNGLIDRGLVRLEGPHAVLLEAP